MRKIAPGYRRLTMICVLATNERENRGTHTSGIVVEIGGRKIALYANGRRHTGENLDKLLKARSAELGRPIQM